MLEQKLNSEQKDETQLPSSPNNIKPNVEPTPAVKMTNQIKVRPYRFIKIN